MVTEGGGESGRGIWLYVAVLRTCVVKGLLYPVSMVHINVQVQHTAGGGGGGGGGVHDAPSSGSRAGSRKGDDKDILTSPAAQRGQPHAPPVRQHSQWSPLVSALVSHPSARPL